MCIVMVIRQNRSQEEEEEEEEEDTGIKYKGDDDGGQIES